LLSVGLDLTSTKIHLGFELLASVLGWLSPRQEVWQNMIKENAIIDCKKNLFICEPLCINIMDKTYIFLTLH
jgi:hypothetical protein